jgi:thiol-disulfide isomerase/thioredoxin
MRAFLAGFFLLLCGFASAEPLTAKGVDGNDYQPLEPGAKKASVLFFVSPFCPTSNNFMPEINSIVKNYGDRVAFYVVEAEPGLQLPDVLRHIELSAITAPVLLDDAIKLAKLTGATITPEAVVLDEKGAKLYQGRINDYYLTPTRKQKQPTTRDLRDALDAILAGKTVNAPSVPAAGCKISGLE